MPLRDESPRSTLAHPLPEALAGTRQETAGMTTLPALLAAIYAATARRTAAIHHWTRQEQGQ